MTAPSCMLLRFPMLMAPSSPLRTAQAQIDDSEPIVTFPITTASGWMYADESMTGSKSPRA